MDSQQNEHIMIESKILSNREKAGDWIESPHVNRFIIVLIVINAIVIGLESSQEGFWIHRKFVELIDQGILLIFSLELIVKLYAFRWRFFTNAWNVFDFVIICFSLLPASGVFSILRTLCVLRTLRLLKKIPRLRIIIDALIHAIPSISWIGVLLLMVFYIFAVISTNLFGNDFPQWFGSIGASMYTLFQIMTLESWSMGIARPIMAKFPHAYLFFIPFILIATYTSINIFIAVVVNAMNEIYSYQGEKEQENKETPHKFILHDNLVLEKKLQDIELELKELKELMRKMTEEKMIIDEVRKN
jgi:voltage-gated sodium channel